VKKEGYRLFILTKLLITAPYTININNALLNYNTWVRGSSSESNNTKHANQSVSNQEIDGPLIRRLGIRTFPRPVTFFCFARQ